MRSQGEGGAASGRDPVVLALQVAAALFVAAHAMGMIWPAPLWGANLLHYFPRWTALLAALAALLPVLSLFAGSARDRLDSGARLVVERLEVLKRCRWALASAAALFVGLSWVLRVRQYGLGDSTKWVELLDATLPRSGQAGLGSMGRGLALGLQHLPPFEALDYFLHLVALQVLNWALGWDARTTFAALSCACGGAFVAAAWRLSAEVEGEALARATLFAWIMSLGIVQLYFGYGEAYTLVSVTVVAYLLALVRSCRGASPWWPALWLGLSAALHLMALSLLPSLVFVFWHRAGRPGGTRVGPLAVAATGLLGLAVYLSWYPYSLALLQDPEPGRHALLSLPHGMLLLNGVLMATPFGLVAGLAGLPGRRPREPLRAALGWATFGACGLVLVHDVQLGGRDWDLLAFPAVAYSVWGWSCMRDSAVAQRLARVSLIPLAALHTGLWVATNADGARSLARLEHLVQVSNQAAHYREWTIGYYYLDVAKSHYDLAADAFRRAVAAAPPEDLTRPGSLGFRYRKFLAVSLERAGRPAAALAEIRRIYAVQEELMADENDPALLTLWGLALHGMATAARARGDTTLAASCWRESLRPFRELAEKRGFPNTYRNLSVVLRQLGEDVEAIGYHRESLAMDPDRAGSMIGLGDHYAAEGRQDLAAMAYAQLLAATVTGLSADDYLRTGTRLYGVGRTAASSEAYGRALAIDPGNATARLNLGWNHQLLGQYAEAIAEYRKLLDSQPSAQAAYNLGLAFLQAGMADSARQAFADAVEAYGGEGSAQAGAVENLRLLSRTSGAAAAAREILERYWPQAPD
ncbi:MAG: tetratricopeptide repeat protein [Gemmatimonadota bacterium]